MYNLSSQKTKALFFDIDGTLLPEHTRQVPESAIAALQAARARGHLIFLNTGRVYGHLKEIRSQIKADGYLCGCGTFIIAEGVILYSYHIPWERGLQFKRDIEECGMDGVLEGVEGCYLRRAPSRLPQVEQLKEAIRRAGGEAPYAWEDDCYEYDKFYLASDSKSRVRELFGRLKDIEIIDRGSGYYECVPRGHSKATAVDLVLKHYGISLDDAYVFGDSSNDLSMFRYARNCILMGNHSSDLEPYATFITKTVEEDGVAYAMKSLGLI